MQLAAFAIFFVSQTGFGPGFGDYIHYLKHFDEQRAREIQLAVLDFIADTSCENFNDLYDSSGVNPLKIKQNES
jgi:hypothetical protein